MKKIVYCLLFISFCLSASLLFVGCGDSFTVKYENQFSFNYEITVKSGKRITYPILDEVAGYTLDGWYNGETKWDFSTDKVTSNVTLVAKWLENPKVVLDCSGGKIDGEKILRTGSIDGGEVTLPLAEKMTKCGFDFVGWNASKDGNGLYLSVVNATSDVTAYAIWQKKTSDDNDENAFLTLLAQLTELENYTKEFYGDYSRESIINQCFVYLRSSVYNDVYYNEIGGNTNEEFANYILENDLTLNINSLRSNTNFYFKSRDKSADLVHMFATMNFEMLGDDKGTLGGWGGDLASLINETKDLAKDLANDENLQTIINGKLADESSSFNVYDVNADLDAVNIVKIIKSNDNLTLAEAFELYYTNGSYANNKQLFVVNKFGSSSNIYNLLYSDMTSNLYILAYYAKNNISYLTSHNPHLQKCCIAFQNYLAN